MSLTEAASDYNRASALQIARLAQIVVPQPSRLIYDVMPARRRLVEEILRLTPQPIVIPTDTHIMLNTGAIVKASSVSIGGDLVNLEGPDSLAKGFI